MSEQYRYVEKQLAPFSNPEKDNTLINKLRFALYSEICAISQDAPQYKKILTPHSWMVMTEEPVADFNMIFLQGENTQKDLMSCYVDLLTRKHIPGHFYISPEISHHHDEKLYNNAIKTHSVPHMIFDSIDYTHAFLKNPYVEKVNSYQDFERAIKLQAQVFESLLGCIPRSSAADKFHKDQLRLFV